MTQVRGEKLIITIFLYLISMQCAAKHVAFTNPRKIMPPWHPTTSPLPPPQKKTLGIIIIFKSHFGENTILKESIHLMDLGMVLSIFKDYLGKLFVLVIYGARLKWLYLECVSKDNFIFLSHKNLWLFSFSFWHFYLFIVFKSL